MRRLASIFRLLYRLLIIGLLCVFANADDVRAAEVSVKIVQNGILNGDLLMQFCAEEIFTGKVIKFLNRGFTIEVEYKIELWRRRRFWFDSLDGQHDISYRTNFEPLDKRYVCLKSQQGTAVTSKLNRKLDEIIQWVTCPEPPLTVIPVKQLDQKGKYYYNIEILIATLTTENIKHLQSWLSEFGGKEKEPSTLTKTSFKVAADFLSSRNHKKISERSEQFFLYDLPKLNN